MPEQWSDKLSDYELVTESAARRVVVRGALHKDYERITPKDKGALLRWMELWCHDADGGLPDTRFKSQARFNGQAGASVLICAFKSYQARLYGFSRLFDGKETFFITAIDPKKKDDAADPRALKKASDEAFSVMKNISCK